MASTFGTSGSWGGGGSRQAAMRFRRLQLLASATDAQLDTKFDKAGGEISGDLEVVGRTVLGDVKIEGETDFNTRIYQELNPDPSWNAVNGYYGLAKDAYPALNPYSSGDKAVSTWTARTTPDNNQWYSVCWSPELGLFVAVAGLGTLNKIMTSRDGINWTPEPLGGAPIPQWFSVCWSAELGLFVAVAITGSDDRVMTSPNGSDWTRHVTPNDNQWSSVCWSAELGLFVAVASNGSTNNKVMYSSNGTTWVNLGITGVIDNAWSSVCWSAELGLFVAVANNGSNDRVMTSPNGINWTTRTTPNNNNWSSVCWSAELGIFVAISQTGVLNRVMTSPDGINWTPRSTPVDNSWSSVCWSAELGIFVAVSDTGNGNRIMTSPDGINWTPRNTPIDNDWVSICWSPELGIFVAVSYAGTLDRVMTSSLAGRPPTSYNVFDSPSNRIDQLGNWTIQQVLKAGTYTAGATTPSVAGANLLVISNASSTTITNFTGGVANQCLTLVFDNGNTVISSNTDIRLAGGAAFTGSQYDTLQLVFIVGQGWLELSRSVNS